MNGPGGGAATRPLFGAATLIVVAKVFGGVSTILLNLWVARHLAPEQYGIFAMGVTTLVLLDGVVGSALDAAIIRGAQPRHAGLSEPERLGLVLKLTAGAGCTAVAALVAWAWTGGAGARVAALTAAGGTGLLVHRSLLVYFQVRERFGPYAALDLAHTIGRWVAVALALSLGSVSAARAVGGYAIAPWLVVAAALILWRELRTSGPQTAEAGELPAVIRFAAVSLATTGVGALVARLDLFLIGAFGDPQQAGLFAAAASLALIPTWLGAYLTPAFSGRIMPRSREGRLQPLLAGVQRVLLLLAVVGTVAGVLLSRWLVQLLLPAEYDSAADVMRVLLASGAAGFVTFPLVLHTLLFLSPRTYLVMDLLSVPVLVPLYIVAAQRYGASGVAWVTAAAAVLKAGMAHLVAFIVARRNDAQWDRIGTPVIVGGQ